MSRPRKLPPNDTLELLIRDGWTYQRIANTYGTTREAVSALVARYKLAPPVVTRKLPDANGLAELLAAGCSRAEIADAYGVTVAAVGHQTRRHSLPPARATHRISLKSCAERP